MSVMYASQQLWDDLSGIWSEAIASLAGKRTIRRRLLKLAHTRMILRMLERIDPVLAESAAADYGEAAPEVLAVITHEFSFHRFTGELTDCIA